MLVGRGVIVVANRKPREMKFGTSEGMVLAAGEPETGLFVATFDGEARPGDGPVTRANAAILGRRFTLPSGAVARQAGADP